VTHSATRSKNCYSDLTGSPPWDKLGYICGPPSDARANGGHKSGSATLEAVTQLPKNGTKRFHQIPFLKDKLTAGTNGNALRPLSVNAVIRQLRYSSSQEDPRNAAYALESRRKPRAAADRQNKRRAPREAALKFGRFPRNAVSVNCPRPGTAIFTKGCEICST